MDLAERYYRSTRGNIHFTGHSLGGGIASAAAIVTGGGATVFNAAGVHANTLRGFAPSNGSVTYFYSAFDVLRLGNTLTPASVPGEHVPLGAAGLHGMGGVCRAMGC
jgi:putative lipase involved disintegration of autophagic bodies